MKVKDRVQESVVPLVAPERSEGDANGAAATRRVPNAAGPSKPPARTSSGIDSNGLECNGPTTEPTISWPYDAFCSIDDMTSSTDSPEPLHDNNRTSNPPTQLNRAPAGGRRRKERPWRHGT